MWVREHAQFSLVQHLSQAIERGFQMVGLAGLGDDRYALKLGCLIAHDFNLTADQG
jgi:hypothetical protein